MTPAYSPSNPLNPVRCWVILVFAGILAGLISGLGGESINGRFIPPLMATSGFPTIEEAQAASRARTSGIRLESALRTGMLGASLGLLLGLATAAIAKARQVALPAAIIGICLGGIVAGLAAWNLVPVFYSFYDPDNDVFLQTLLIHSAIAATVGITSGFTFALGLQSCLKLKIPGLTRNTIMGGLLGAIAATLIFQIFGMIVFPLDQTNLPISKTTMSRLAGNLILALLTAVGICRFAISTEIPSEEKTVLPTT